MNRSLSPNLTLDDRSVEIAVGRLLRIGVLAASGVIALGGILNLLRHGMEPVTWERFHGEPAALRTLSGILEAALAAQGKGIIQLGLMLLIAVPVVRVAISAFLFVRKRDFVFAALTTAVLAILAYSLLFAS
jgi:uncharacterized membrane protein